MKISADFDPEKQLERIKVTSRKEFWRDFWFAKFLPIVGWCSWFFIAFFASQFIVAFAISFLSRALNWNVKSLSDFADAIVECALYILLIGLFVVVPMWFLRRRAVKKDLCSKSETSVQTSSDFAKNFRELVGLSRRPKFRDFGWALYFVPIFYFLLLLANLLASWIFGSNAMNQAQNLSFQNTTDPLQLWIIGLVVCLVAPIAEEILLRGFLFTKIREKFRGPSGFWLTAIIVSSVFAVAHGQLNVGIMTFILSMCNSRIRENSGVIYGAILLHAGVNFLSFAVRYLGLLHGLAGI